MTERAFVHDTVEGHTPLTFAMSFVEALRKEKAITHVPSLRTTIAIPRFLAARYFRRRALTPRDYLDAAILNTVYEDQHIAERVAHTILFPKTEAPPVTAKIVPDKPASAPANPAAAAAVDPMQAIFDDIANLDIDLDALDSLGGLDSLLDQADDQELFKSFSLFESLTASEDPTQRALGRLVHRYGGADAMEADGIDDLAKVEEFAREHLRGRIGDLEPEEVADGCEAGFGPVLLRETTQSWELAATFAGTKDFDGLSAHLKDLLEAGTSRDIGRTLRYLDPHAGVLTGSELVSFREAGKARARDLSDWAELLDGVKKLMEPPDELVRKSAVDNVTRALAAARWIEASYGHPLQARVFERWAEVQDVPPDLQTVLELCVPQSSAWVDLMHDCYRRWVKRLDDGLVGSLGQALTMAQQLAASRTELGKKLAAKLTTDALCAVRDRDVFLPLLDEFLEAGLFPDDVKAIVAHAVKLGIPEDAVLERLDRPIDQLKLLIQGGDVDSVERYGRLCLKIENLPEELLEQLVQQCVGDGNQCGMAALLAIDLARSSALAPADFAADSLGHKGIGGGTNLLKQWFTARDSLGADALRQRIKAIARNALVDLAFEWIAKGVGENGEGLTPQNEARPFSGGDDLDDLDLESTMEAVISAGKSLDQISDEDLWVHVRAKGRAAMAVLIDISGSMSPRDLATCAIATVMLLGRLKSEEVAIALFESDTHVVKNLADERDLDEVSDQLLELRATGGTRVDAALQWAADQLDSVSDVDFRVLFLLSDFCFFESKEELKKHALRLADMGVRFLGASHGYVCVGCGELLRDTIGGDVVKLDKLDALPALLHDAIVRIGDGGG